MLVSKHRPEGSSSCHRESSDECFSFKDFCLFRYFSFFFSRFPLMRGKISPKTSLCRSLQFLTRKNFGELTRKNWNCLQFAISMLWRRFTSDERSAGELNFLSTPKYQNARKKLCCSVAFSFGYINEEKVGLRFIGLEILLPSKTERKEIEKVFLLLLNVRQKVRIFHVENCCS